MGRVSLKILFVFLLLLLSFSAVYADTAQFIYRNFVSSSDFDVLPKPGRVYYDENGNVFIVRKILESVKDRESGEKEHVVVFDKHYVGESGLKLGSQLSGKFALFRINVMGSLKCTLADFSFTTVTYPFEPLVMAGISYGDGQAAHLLIMAGTRITVPLSNLYSSETFTLIEDGRLEGFLAAGVRIGGNSYSGNVKFACTYGFGYKHNLGIFNWGVHAVWLSGSWGLGSITPGISVGVNF